ncbi:conserved hypothetical protein [Cupriavidus taiwanensis]|nr:conserved hypothetical protein [Cupriavidus taiwanensis]
MAGRPGAPIITMRERATAAMGRTSLSGSNAGLSTCGTSVSTLLAVTMMVWPSAGAASMVVMAMPPPAPGLLSTTTGWPRSADSWSASRRASTSMVPPAGAGTSIRTGLLVQAMAEGAASARLAAAAAMRSRKAGWMGMLSPLCSMDLDCPACRHRRQDLRAFRLAHPRPAPDFQPGPGATLAIAVGKIHSANVDAGIGEGVGVMHRGLLWCLAQGRLVRRPRGQPSGRRAQRQVLLPRLAVGGHAIGLQRGVGAVVPGADAVDLAGLLARGDLAAQFLRHAHALLDLLHRGHAVAVLVDDGVLDAAARMQAHRHRHHVERQHILQQRLGGQRAAVRGAVHEVEEVERVGAVKAAADADPGQVQRTGVDAGAHQPLQRFQRVHAGQLEMRLDARGLQPAQVLFDPARAGRHGHLAVGGLVGRVLQRSPLQVLRIEQLHDVHLRGVDRHGHLVRLRLQLGQHMAGVVRQPLGLLAVILRRERDRAADLDDHVRHRGAHAGDQFVELGQALGALAVEFAHVQVQHGGTGVVAIHRLLHLLFHGHRNVFREVLRHPLGAIRGHGDHHLVHVLGVQGIVEELHKSLRLVGDWSIGQRTAAI